MIYLLGGSGYVGKAYRKLLIARDIPFISLQRSDVDYTDVKTLLGALNKDRPDFLINAAGYTGKPNVDACETDKANCLFGNAVLPGRIAEACEQAGIPWGHVSSGCIYTGRRADGTGFTEADAPNFTFRQSNCSYYSGTKALGEEILGNHYKTYIWRLRIPFNHEDCTRNYLSKLMCYDRLLDVTNSLSQLDEFVSASLACWERKVPYGIYNMTNPGHVTTTEVTEMIHASGVCMKNFKFFNDETEFMNAAAKTPRSNCILNSEKLISVGISMTPIRESIHHALANWQPSRETSIHHS